MLRSESSRFAFTIAIWLLTLVFAAASFFVDGLFGWILAAPAVLLGIVASAFSAWILDYNRGAAPFVFGFVNGVLMTLAGCLMFGWWGIAFAVVMDAIWFLALAIKGNN